VETRSGRAVQTPESITDHLEIGLLLLRSRGLFSDCPLAREIALAEAISTRFLTILPHYDPKMDELASLSAPCQLSNGVVLKI
jgi:hypothetical protein